MRFETYVAPNSPTSYQKSAGMPGPVVKTLAQHPLGPALNRAV
jgi:hypothetical protein